VPADPKVWDTDARGRFIQAVRKMSDFGGVWYDRRDHPADDKTYGVETVYFTKNVDRHRAEVRALWGGPLCVVKVERSLGHLEDVVQAIVHDKHYGFLEVGVNEVDNDVQLVVVVADRELRQELDDRFGPGTVKALGAFRRIAG